VKQCVDALKNHTIYPIHETILVNDGSPDLSELKEYVKEIKMQLGFDIVLIERKENRGFAFTCNEGADHARGEYLLFLNFDTLPQRGWLLALTRFLHEHKNAGVLGSRLLYPGVNLIQHLGGAINKEKKPSHIYKGQPAFLPFLNKNRRLQWVTGASLLISKKDFNAVSGFDETFVTSSEDVDLCFKVRFKLGKEVWMVSDSWLYHYTDVTGATSRNIERTHPIFINRWKDRLIADEDKIYEEDGFSPEILNLMEQCGIYRDFGTISMVLQSLDIEDVEKQKEYVKTMGIHGLRKDLEEIARQFPRYNILKPAASHMETQGTVDSLNTFFIQRLTGILSNPGLSQKERHSITSQLMEKLDSIRFFYIIYNMASMFSATGENEKAGNLFSFLSLYMESSAPQLAGKAWFKLSGLTAEIEMKKDYLKRCLALYPEHRKARENLAAVEDIR
jgi:GT2 family glycosyltransferase